ncbi:hypothetical protein IAT40_000431 [Kwoniella sp. CBS 6097]
MSDTSADNRSAFEAASKWLSASPSAAGLPNDVKLELYGLFKYIGTGNGPTGNRPSMFSPASRAKYDAWSTQHHKYSSTAGDTGLHEARTRYVMIANSVGWHGRIGEDSDDDEVDLENLDDPVEPKEVADSRKVCDNAMGGVKVSVMSNGDGDVPQQLSSPIHDAVVARSNAQIQQILARDRSSVNTKDEYGYTPLHLAADRGYPEIVEILLDHGADMTLQDDDECTARDLAQVSGRAEIVAVLDRYT